MQRGGVVRYSLVVHEPGITLRARRLLRLWRSWPLLAASLLVLALVATATVFSPPLVLAAGVLCYCIGFVILALATRSERRRTRRLWVEEPSEPAASDEVAACARIKCLGNLLVEADEDVALGRITPVQHALVWSQVYTDLSLGHAVTPRTLHPHSH